MTLTPDHLITASLDYQTTMPQSSASDTTSGDDSNNSATQSMSLTTVSFAQSTLMSGVLGQNALQLVPASIQLQPTMNTASSLQVIQHSTSGLLALPLEILQQILRSADSGPGQLGALVSTCKQMHLQLHEYQKLLVIVDAFSVNPSRKWQKVVMKQSWMSYQLLQRASTWKKRSH